jgi:hypothetical protein
MEALGAILWYDSFVLGNLMIVLDASLIHAQTRNQQERLET